jgi:hypothetical protein
MLLSLWRIHYRHCSPLYKPVLQVDVLVSSVLAFELIYTHVPLAPPPFTYNLQISPPLNFIPAPKTYAHVASQLPPTVYAPPLTTDFLARAAHLTSTNPTSYPQGVVRLRSKLIILKDQRENSRIVCYCCGDLGHLSSAYHNLIVCFFCYKAGHRSWQCRSVPRRICSSFSLLNRSRKLI